MPYDQIPSDDVINKTVEALKANGIEAIIVANQTEAKQKALELIPQGSEIMTMSSVTVDGIGLGAELNESGHFDPIRKKFAAMDQKTQKLEMNRLGAAMGYAIGSVHAVTQNGQVMIASASGSQLPAYAYAALNVIWVVGAQKIVANLDEGMKRIYEYVLPLEDVRAMKAYNMHSSVNKMLVINKEVFPGRIKMILIKEVLGY